VAACLRAPAPVFSVLSLVFSFACELSTPRIPTLDPTMKAKKPNAELVWKQLEDQLAPCLRLSVISSASNASTVCAAPRRRSSAWTTSCRKRARGAIPTATWFPAAWNATRRKEKPPPNSPPASAPSTPSSPANSVLPFQGRTDILVCLVVALVAAPFPTQPIIGHQPRGEFSD